MISMILAIGPDELIGIKDKLPWHSKKDFEHFKEYTLNKTVLFGDRTFFGLPKYPLPKRDNFVVSFNINHTKIYNMDNKKYWMFPSIEEAITEFNKQKNKELVICGGKGVYSYCLQNNLIDKVVLTEVNSSALKILADTHSSDNVYMTGLKNILTTNFKLEESTVQTEMDLNELKLIFTTWLKY